MTKRDKVLESISYRINSECYKHHSNPEWSKIVAKKVLNDILDIFEDYNQFLLKEGYCDTDIICEEPTSLDQFLLKEP
jgi:hypothetical protein